MKGVWFNIGGKVMIATQIYVLTFWRAYALKIAAKLFIPNFRFGLSEECAI